MRNSPQALPRSERLRSKLLWEAVMKKGDTLFHFPVKAWIMPLESTHLQVAFVAPKRRFRKAVMRNRQKRMLREAYRLSPHRPEFGICYALVFLSVAPEETDIASFQKGMDKLLLQFKNHLNDHSGN